MAENKTITVGNAAVGTLNITGQVHDDSMEPDTIVGGTYIDLHETEHNLTGDQARKIIESATSEAEALAIVHEGTE